MEQAEPRTSELTTQLPDTVWTVGHSTRTASDFISILRSQGIEAVADVRRFPGSRRYPQFGQEALKASLADAGIRYCWIGSLGGRRSAARDSRNLAWKNAAFRGYADHMGSDEFAAGLKELLVLAGGARSAIMCSEAVWWRCHRGLIADLLRSWGVNVKHIVGEGPAEPHPYTGAARLANGRLTYDPAKGEPAAQLHGPGVQPSLL